MKHDWNFEPNEDECDVCETEECECGDTHEPDTIAEYLGDE